MHDKDRLGFEAYIRERLDEVWDNGAASENAQRTAQDIRLGHGDDNNQRNRYLQTPARNAGHIYMILPNGTRVPSPPNSGPYTPGTYLEHENVVTA